MTLFKRLIAWAIQLATAFLAVYALLDVIVVSSVQQLPDLRNWFPVWTQFIAAALLAFGFTLLSRWLGSSSDENHALKQESKKFTKFYESWYRQSGELLIFCKDTDWLEPPIVAPVVKAVKDKGPRAHVFVRNMAGKTVAELKLAGVDVVAVPTSVGFDTRLSLLMDEGDRQLIVRDSSRRPKRKGYNVFRETSDPYTIKLAEDLFRSIKPDAIP